MMDFNQNPMSIFVALCLWLMALCLNTIDAIDVELPSSIEFKEKANNKLSISTLISGKHYETDYLEINRLLQSHEPTEDAELNLRAARNILIEKQKTKPGLLKKSMLKALEQFVALDKIRNGVGTRCNWNSYAILKKNKQAVSKAPGPIERISAVLRQVFDEHAAFCLPKYVTKFNRKYAELDQARLAEPEKYVMKLHPGGFTLKRGGWPCSITSVANERYCVTSNVQSLVETVRDHSDPDKDWLETRGKMNDKPSKNDLKRVRSLVNKYLVEPCDYYMENLANGEEMHENLWVPATQDIVWQFDNTEISNEDERRFYLARETIKFCRMYTIDRHYRVELLVEEILKRYV